ncbi:hypothetical protein ACIQ9Q_09620 [Streptomyces sp. NPDC094438]|uniref:hypothetical protein n=1 Tax=Streptomyces sp. NPDC094438 TaxID=3366061 RepID=UPI0037F5A58B
MLFKAPTGKVHSSLVDHDRCVFIRNNAKTDYSALSELPVDDYESGDDCMNCESAIAGEVKSNKNSETPLPFEDDDLSSDGVEPEGDDDWEDEDEFVPDPQKKEEAERELGIRDADAALYQWEILAERTDSPKGRAFWESKIAQLKARIEFVPEPEKAESSAPDKTAEENIVAPEQAAEEVKPARRTAKRAVTTTAK